MEHPIFALRAGDRRVRRYERNGITVEISPGSDGCATVHDKDVWIYCISQLVEAMNRGREDIGRTVRFTAYDFLVSTNRPTSGVGYQRMEAALRRLDGTRIRTNIESGGIRDKTSFGLIEAWHIIEGIGDDRTRPIEVTLPDWLWRSISAWRVLSVDRKYFKLRKPLERRLYELARKHCGPQARWRAKLGTLYEKSGSTAPLRNFRIAVKALAECNGLPGYLMAFDPEVDTMTFFPRTTEHTNAQLTALRHVADNSKWSCG